LLSGEAGCRPCFRLGGDFLAVAGRLRRLHRIEQFTGTIRNRHDRVFESGLVAFRWLVGSAELAHELERRIVDFRVRRRRIEIEQGLDVPAHAFASL